MGAATHASNGPTVDLNARRIFMAIAGVVLTLVLLSAVVVPAVERGGIGELIGVAAIFVAILLAERWARGR